MFRISLTLCLVLIASVAVARYQGNMQIDESTQRPGGDYTNFYTENEQQCARSCSRDSRCQAFDFDRQARTCWLKDRIPRARTNYNTVSGRKRDASGGSGSEIVGGIRLIPGKSHSGNDYTNFRTDRAEQCAMECARDPRCQAFDYNTNNRACWLKDRVPPVKNARGVVTGVKGYHNNGDNWQGEGRPGRHPDGDIYWDYASHRPCPPGYVNCDTKGSCGRRGNETTCRNLGGGGQGHRPGDIYWDYASHRPCPPGYVNCDTKGSCGRRGNEATCGNFGGGGQGHRPGDIYWDYKNHRPCPNGYVNCDSRGSCGKKGNASRCR